MYQYIRGHVVKMSTSERLSVYKEEEETRIRALTDKFNREVVLLELGTINDISTLIANHLTTLTGPINNHLLIMLTCYIEKLQYDMSGDLVIDFYDKLTEFYSKLKAYSYSQELDTTACLACVNELLSCINGMRSDIKKNSQFESIG